MARNSLRAEECKEQCQRTGRAERHRKKKTAIAQKQCNDLCFPPTNIDRQGVQQIGCSPVWTLLQLLLLLIF